MPRGIFALANQSVTHVFSMDFVRLFLRRHFAGKPVEFSQNVGCFLKLQIKKSFIIKLICAVDKLNPYISLVI